MNQTLAKTFWLDYEISFDTLNDQCTSHVMSMFLHWVLNQLTLPLSFMYNHFFWLCVLAIAILVQSRKLQASGWQPRWFKRDSDDGTFRYIGGYWEGREQQKWEGCINIFGEFSNDATASTCIKSELMPWGLDSVMFYEVFLLLSP